MIRSTLKSGIKKLLGRAESPPPGPPQPYRFTPKTPEPVAPAPAAAAPEAEPTPEPSAAPAPAASAAPAALAGPAAVEPAAASAPADDTLAGPALDPQAVQELLDEMVRPALQADGGDISLVRVEGNDVYVRLVGSCSTCPSSIATMKMGVEALFREEFPGMGQLIQVG